MNPRISKPYLHVQISFCPGKWFNGQALTTLVMSYLAELGYGDQPYLVYVHLDTAYQRISIVSVSIDADGRCIWDAHLQRRSDSTGLRLEAEYGLKPAGLPPTGDLLNANEL